jgi:hypothetical protein
MKDSNIKVGQGNRYSGRQVNSNRDIIFGILIRYLWLIVDRPQFKRSSG